MTPIILVTSLSILNPDLAKKLQLDLSTPHPDLLVIDQEGKLGIDLIRRLSSFLHTPPLKKPLKYLLLANSHQLTSEAQNAFLKTLEESLPTTQIILLTPQPHRLLPTIVSRCRLQYLTKPTPASQTDENDLLLYNSILDSNLPQRFLLAQKHASQRQSAQTLIQGLIQISRHRLFASPSAITLHNLKILHLAQSYLHANTNVKLTLEFAFSRLQKS